MSRLTEEETRDMQLAAWCVIGAITRDLKPYIERFEDEYEVTVELKHTHFHGGETLSVYINHHFGYVIRFEAWKPDIQTIGFDEEPLSDPNEHAVELILEPLLLDRLDRYSRIPIKDLISESEVEAYFVKVAKERGYE